jgi:hypothetical protein
VQGRVQGDEHVSDMDCRLKAKKALTNESQSPHSLLSAEASDNDVH